MTKKKYLGQFISVKFINRKEPIRGFVIDYNDDWTLMKHNPVEFVIDGYIIFRHKNIEGFRRGPQEKFLEKVITLKGQQANDTEKIPINDLKTILKYLTNKHGLFQLETKSQKICYLGRLVSIDNKLLTLEFIDTKGRWDGNINFKTTDIRIIEFDNDYINSLKLVAEQK
jgi:hypothetical protein